MALTSLRCPECTAPVERAASKCTYCGATLVAERPRAARTEERHYVLMRIAPSNVERVARLLQRRLRDAEQAKAVALAAALEAAGGRATVSAG